MLRKYERAVVLPVFSATRCASEFATAFAMSVLPQPGGPYSRMPFGGCSSCSRNMSRVQVRQLDRVLDHLDLVVEAADVGVGDVGDLFEHELLDLGPRQPLERAGRSGRP